MAGMQKPEMEHRTETMHRKLSRKCHCRHIQVHPNPHTNLTIAHSSNTALSCRRSNQLKPGGVRMEKANGGVEHEL